jgi:hypothetical protein
MNILGRKPKIQEVPVPEPATAYIETGVANKPQIVTSPKTTHTPPEPIKIDMAEEAILYYNEKYANCIPMEGLHLGALYSMQFAIYAELYQIRRLLEEMNKE